MTTSTLLAALIAGSLFRFNVGPDVPPLETQMPPAMEVSVSADVVRPEFSWWTLYDDPVLNACVDQAFKRNAGLDMAVARVEQARAALGESRSFQSPTLDAQGSTARGRVLGPVAGSQTEQDQNILLGSVNYEVDFFGRMKKATAAARADWFATQAARDSVRLILAGDVAKTYFGLRGADAQLRIAQKTLAARVLSLELQRQRYKLGRDSELNYRRSLADTAQIAVQVKQFENSLARHEHALLVLLGYDPKDMVRIRGEAAVSADKGPRLPDIPVGLPSDILERRPDILRAQQQYLAAMARVGQANAARYPSFSLTGLFGTASSELGDLFSGPTGWSLTGQLLAPVFDAGRRKSRLEQAEARAWEARVFYEQTVRVAFQETLNALVNREKLNQTGDLLTAREEAQQRAYELASFLYAKGRVGQIDVLDAERLLLQAQLDRESNYTGQLNAVVDVCLAIGGGWKVRASDDIELLPVKKRYLQ